MRNMTAYQLGKIMDNMPYAANGRSVDVYVNGQYQGVYFLVETVSVNKNRVAITENPELIEENGYLIHMSRYAEENVFTVDFCNYEVKSDVSADATVAEQQIDYIADYTEKALHALKSGDQEAVSQYIDIPSLVDNCIANEICKNVDSGWDSYYMSKDAGGKLTFNPMWDYDLALGNSTEAKGISEPEGLCIFNVTDSCANSNPWLCYAVECGWFREMLKERWNEKLADIKTISDFVLNEAEINIASYDRNFTRWDLLGNSIYNEPEEIAVLKTHKAHAQYLADWLDTRIEWLDRYYNSAEFTDGLFLDENDKAIDTKNMIANSALMFWNMEGDVDTDSPGFTGEATTGWRGGQAISAGLMLKNGQRYKLSFDYTGLEATSISYRFQQNYGSYSPIWSGSVNCNGDLQTFETEFTANVTDNNVAFVMEFKGTGTVKVENMSLIALESVRGDVNVDGEFSVADVVLLQKWLLAVPDTHLANWKAADFCKDDRLDVFDLCLMKRELIEKMNDIPQNVDTSFKLQSVADIRANGDNHTKWAGYIARSENDLIDIIKENEGVSADEISLEDIDDNVFNDKSLVIIYGICTAGNSYSIIDDISIKSTDIDVSTVSKKPEIATPDMLYRRYIYIIDKNAVTNVSGFTFNDTSSFYQNDEKSDVVNWFKDWCRS